MAGLCEGGNEPSDSLKAICNHDNPEVQLTLPVLDLPENLEADNIRDGGSSMEQREQAVPFLPTPLTEIVRYVFIIMDRPRKAKTAIVSRLIAAKCERLEPFSSAVRDDHYDATTIEFLTETHILSIPDVNADFIFLQKIMGVGLHAQAGCELMAGISLPVDLAPSDFHLFTKLKDFLGGTRFGSDEELKKTVNTWLNELAAEEYNTGILKLVNRYDKCLNVGGDYVEK
ncbi:hypothetical protein ANN_11944 [Periplaneta americana]|uniref:Uncharacterized protein n=1 Tax=Periplaneta americana TaxID=6978 RepID=A0ABQ8T6G7_PERAM|nr:hypothetical protein ANN_11944 [Periplaneta americana]